jgi:murein DD-endopeptidase MepM/ murein hydrolase activator NlpD
MEKELKIYDQPRRFKKINPLVIISAIAAFFIIVSVVLAYQLISLSTTTKKAYLNYGFNSSWKIFTVAFSKYYQNIPNKVVTENYWQARRWFDEETRTLYQIQTLESWERDMDRINTNLNLSYNFFHKKFLELAPVFPIDSFVFTSSYGYRYSPFKNQSGIGPTDQEFHQGVDISAIKGMNVYSFLDGVVVESRYRSGYGNVIVIDHGQGFKTKYAHLKMRLVRTGDNVKKAAVIALSGNTGRSTGPHLHFEIYYQGQLIDPYYLYPSF